MSIPFFDPSYLTEISDGDKEFQFELIDMYLTETAEKLQELEKSLGNKDLENSAFLAHFIKGASGNMGCTQMKEGCSELEQMIKTHTGDDLDRLFSRANKIVQNMQQSTWKETTLELHAYVGVSSSQ
jgi:HPt (histidine-containing phosphotransfer) domain-containing protein